MKAWARTPSYWFDSRLRYFVKHHGVALRRRGDGWRSSPAAWSGAPGWLIQRLPPGDPPHFLRDLVAHAFRACQPRAAAPAARSRRRRATVRRRDRGPRPIGEQHEHLFLHRDRQRVAGHPVRRHAAGSAATRSPRWSRATPSVRAWAEGDGACASRSRAPDLADRLGPLSVRLAVQHRQPRDRSPMPCWPRRPGARSTSTTARCRATPGSTRRSGRSSTARRRHGVTWHLIEGGIDEGDIVEQRTLRPRRRTRPR